MEIIRLFVVVSLEDAGVGETSVGAGGEQREAVVLLLETVRSSGHQARSGGAEGVAQGQRAAAGVDLCG